jgi:trigger factor
VHGFDHDEDRFAEFLAEQGKTREEFENEAREEAEKSVRARLLLDALADSEQVTVSDEELTERIVMQAQQYRMPPEEFVRRIQEAGQLGAIYSDVRRTKALIAAVRAATVTDASGERVDLSEVLGSEETGSDGPGSDEAGSEATGIEGTAGGTAAGGAADEVAAESTVDAEPAAGDATEDRPSRIS